MANMYGAIDLGGSKIEACLFDEQLKVVCKQRVATPRTSYAELLEALLAQCYFLEQQAGQKNLPIGLGVPGLIDRSTGNALTANLPATGHPLPADLIARLGRSIAVENDCNCFVLSEAHGGAGDGHDVVFGVILGTGIGGGLCRHGELMTQHNGTSGEVGHLALPFPLAQKWNLPILTCGCGRQGCYETLVAGPGLSRLSQHLTGTAHSVPDIVQGYRAKEPRLHAVYALWLELLCELILSIQLVVDPDCLVLGGGLSQIENLTKQLTQAFPAHQLPGMKAPVFAQAYFGDSGGVRGAAMLAKMHAEALRSPLEIRT